MSDLSHEIGPKGDPLWEKTIGQVLDDTISMHADSEALVSLHQDIRWTYREFGAQVDQLAAGLIALGLKRGDRVGIWSPNNTEWVVTQFATARAGLILVTINPAYRLVELEYALNKVECKALVLADKFKSSDYVKMIQTLAPEIGASTPGNLKAGKLPHLRLAVVIAEEAPDGFITYGDIMEAATPAAADALDALQQEFIYKTGNTNHFRHKCTMLVALPHKQTIG